MLDRNEGRVYFLDMPFSQRPIQDDHDLLAMLALARAHRTETLHDVDLPYRLCSWALDETQNTQLWFDEANALVGWVILQTPFWTIDFEYAHPAEAELAPTILAWADARAKQIVNEPSGHPSWFALAFRRQTARAKYLEALGFVAQTEADWPWSKALLKHTTSIPVPTVPPGFAIRPLAGQAEVAGYVELHRTAFDTKNMTEPWRARTLLRPEYRPDLDVVVTAPDGRLAAFCIAWIDRTDSDKPIGRIEPLGTHPDFRKLGLGRAALLEAMRRLRALGADTIYVESDKTEGSAFPFYRGQGFEVVEEVDVFGKTYA